MKVDEIGRRFLIRGDLGDMLPSGLVDLARERGWVSGTITGIGGVRDVNLAYFDVASRSYLPITIEGNVELVSLNGNLAVVDGQPFWHLHAVVSDASGKAMAGHLSSLQVAVTLECWAEIGDKVVSRELDERTGLNLLKL